ncbi:MAG: hypothetical protein J0G36_01045 [Afipia sp.]|jgi:hypothetical protein|nr:hypothetical protein [Afipia sp.]
MKKAIAIIFLVIAILGGWMIRNGLEADDWIDRCADNSHPRYIQDKTSREKACKLN